MTSPFSQLEALYDKTYECPICYTEFTTKAIRSGSNKVVSTDSDLYSHYDVVNPIIYDVILCNCGYAAISKVFNEIRHRQIEWIKDGVTSKYQFTYYPEVLTEEEAVPRYKLALLNAKVKQAPIGEKAYLCLKIGWLYRDLEDKENERLFLGFALKYFLEAFSTESFPIFELDELTTMYLIAELSRKAGDFDTALKWAGELITQSGAPSRLKDRARTLRDRIKANQQ